MLLSINFPPQPHSLPPPPPSIATTVFGRVCCWDSVLICHIPTWLHSVKTVLWLLLLESHFFYAYFLIASYVRNTNSPCCINYSCRAFAIRIRCSPIWLPSMTLNCAYNSCHVWLFSFYAISSAIICYMLLFIGTYKPYRPLCCGLIKALLVYWSLCLCTCVLPIKFVAYYVAWYAFCQTYMLFVILLASCTSCTHEYAILYCLASWTCCYASMYCPLCLFTSRACCAHKYVLFFMALSHVYVVYGFICILSLCLCQPPLPSPMHIIYLFPCTAYLCYIHV